MTARYREPYSLFARRLKSGLTMWYYQTYDDDGKRTAPKSTGIGYKSKRDEAKTRREAKAMLDEMYRRGKLGGTTDLLTLAQWVERHRFWDWQRSTYVRGIMKRSEEDRPGITETYFRGGKAAWEQRIRGEHGDKLIDEITPNDCEELLFYWSSQVTHKTANNYRSYYSTMMSEAVRLGDIAKNPWDNVQQLAVKSKPRGGITLAEVSKMLDVDPATLDEHARMYFLATKTAFLAGLRIAEVIGLTTDDVRSKTITAGDAEVTMHYLDVRRQWSKKLHRHVPVKDKDARAVPITPDLVRELEPLMLGRDRFLFSFHPRHETPLSENLLRLWSYKRMGEVGISDDDRRARGIVFHSARRFFNTLLRRSVSDDVLRKMTGHDSDEMTEHYTDYLPEDLLAIADAQAKLSSRLPGPQS